MRKADCEGVCDRCVSQKELERSRTIIVLAVLELFLVTCFGVVLFISSVFWRERIQLGACRAIVIFAAWRKLGEAGGAGALDMACTIPHV